MLMIQTPTAVRHRQGGQDGIYKMNKLTVALSTPGGLVFTASAVSIDVLTADGGLHVNSALESFLNLIHVTKITLRTVEETHVFDLENAVAGLKGRTFTVLAERIRRIEPQVAPEPEPRRPPSADKQ